MKVVFTEDALRDLDDIHTFVQANYPRILPALNGRLRVALARIGDWPESGREVPARPGVRVVPLVRYPYRLFYRVVGGRVEILHIHHTARHEPWTGDE